MGAAIEKFNERAAAGERVADLRVRGGNLHGIEVGPEWVARTIDEYPILAIAGSLAEGTTVFSGIKELRYKESDRIAAMTEGLRILGVPVDEREDGMTIHGGERAQRRCGTQFRRSSNRHVLRHRRFAEPARGVHR